MRVTMPSKLMEVLKLAANWLQIEGVEGVSANEDEDCIEVFVSEKFDKNSNSVSNVFHGYNVSIIEND
jgi:hypothetical protein